MKLVYAGLLFQVFKFKRITPLGGAVNAAQCSLVKLDQPTTLNPDSYVLFFLPPVHPFLNDVLRVLHERQLIQHYAYGGYDST